ncbi:hypothetical protein [Nannocystis radixulma]|uniref:Beta/Gamma crystallin n=1 Tax=Nannocystis radixulma TaxID=2995305 RepID=A0ABT5B3N4_9BACT|nr:hypothetical protein [Nannocystis radixulma]MDC0667686.1 hypothetical protein [Nannocystis radixulma]
MRHLVASAALAATLIAQPLVAHAQGCTIYQHRDFGGSSWWFDDGDRMIMIEGEDLGCVNSEGGSCGYTYYEASWNDQLSSYTVEPGCEIWMWEDIDEGGAQWHSDRSYSYVGSDWNDEVSEVYCACS